MPTLLRCSTLIRCSGLARCSAILASPFLLAVLASAQATSPASTPPAGKAIRLNVVVTDKSGAPVGELPQTAFTLLDDHVRQTLQSFHQLHHTDTPIEAILLLDDVNVYYSAMASEKDQIEKFLRADSGHLAIPTTLAILTDTGTRIQPGYSTDGTRLATALQSTVIPLRSNNPDTGVAGDLERLQLCIKTLNQLIDRESPRPGHKLILWVSRGWPLLSQPGMTTTRKDQQNIFAEIVNLSTRLRQANITLYQVNPLGANESVGQQAFYAVFLKGVEKPSQTDPNDLSLQVLATQTGGLVLSSNSVAGMLNRCVQESTNSYELTFNPSPAEHPDQYHSISVHIDQPNLTARTFAGYYNQP
jgi:VWFA-related protein